MGNCAKTVLVSVNLIILVIGIGFFAAGGCLAWAPQIIDRYLNLDDLADAIPAFAADLGVTDIRDGKFDKDSNSLAAFGIPLLVLGAGIFVTGFLGLCGACYSNKCMLVTYLILVILVILAQVFVIVAFVAPWYRDGVKDFLMEGLKKDYKGIDDYTVTGMLWNYVMLGYGCCGIYGGEDFEDANKWDRIREFSINNTLTNITIDFPLACCKNKGNFPKRIVPNGDNCGPTFTIDNSNAHKGCWDELEEDMKEQTVAFAAVIGALMGVQLICAICAIVMIHKTRADKSANYTS